MEKGEDLELGEHYEQRDTEHGKSESTDSRYKPYSITSKNTRHNSFPYKLFVINIPFSVDSSTLSKHMSKGI